MGRLEGRTAIVTGASRGLGQAIAVAMAAEGARVAVVARTEQVWDERLPGTIHETVDLIRRAGGQAVAIRADLLQAADRARLVDEARAAFGPITILVNNAAFTAPGRPASADTSAARTPPNASPPPGAKSEWPSFLSTTPRAYTRHFEMVFAAYELMQRVVPDMRTEGHGAIVNITSGASRLPGDGPYADRSFGTLAGYGGSKAALEHLSQVAAFDLAEFKIAVNSLSPSKTFLTPGVAYYAKAFNDVAPEAEFGEAAVRLAVVDPAVVTGRTIGHAQVLDGSFQPYAMNELPA